MLSVPESVKKGWLGFEYLLYGNKIDLDFLYSLLEINHYVTSFISSTRIMFYKSSKLNIGN